MTEVAEVFDEASEVLAAGEHSQPATTPDSGDPPNVVHARVGDAVLRAARDRVRSGMQPEQIIREIVAEYNVRMNIGELRLLLATRTKPSDLVRPRYSFDAPAAPSGDNAT